MPRTNWIYILANRKNGTLYTGSTSDLLLRLEQHRNKVDLKSFTARYDICKLVYYEIADNKDEALKREHRLKRWKRAWKIALIEDSNPHWDD